jgi:hypothetical protein
MVTDCTENPLKRILRGNRSAVQSFKVKPWYSAEGDHLTVFFSPEMCYAERQDGLLTVFISERTGDLVGCKIKGISQLVENIKTTIRVTKDECEMNLILLAASGTAPHKEYMYQLAEKVVGITIPFSSLKAA